MKKILFIGLLLMAMTINSQTVDGKSLDDFEGPYFEITYHGKGLKSSVSWFSSGEPGDEPLGRTGNIMGADGKEIKFTNVAHLMNYFDNKGFKVEYYISTGGDQVRLHTIILKRKE